MNENEILETTTEQVEPETELNEEVSTETDSVVEVGADSETISNDSSTSDVVYIDANNVMLMSEDPESYAVGDNNGYQLPSYYVEYFRGVVDNLGDSEYIAFATRDYSTSSGYNTYTEHYTLVYDIEVVDSIAVSGSYPCIDIYRDSGNSYYIYEESVYSLTSYPSFSYGSFGHLSSLGKGDSYGQVTALCFAVIIGFLYFLCRSIFSKRF